MHLQDYTNLWGPQDVDHGPGRSTSIVGSRIIANTIRLPRGSIPSECHEPQPNDGGIFVLDAKVGLTWGTISYTAHPVPEDPLGMEEHQLDIILD